MVKKKRDNLRKNKKRGLENVSETKNCFCQCAIGTV